MNKVCVCNVLFVCTLHMVTWSFLSFALNTIHVSIDNIVSAPQSADCPYCGKSCSELTYMVLEQSSQVITAVPSLSLGGVVLMLVNIVNLLYVQEAEACWQA